MGIPEAVAQIIKLILWVMGYFMKRAEINIAAKESFYLYVKEMSRLNLVPSNLKAESDKQLFNLIERKRKMIEELERENKESEKEVPGNLH